MDVERIMRTGVHKVERKKAEVQPSTTFSEVMNKQRTDKAVEQLTKLMHKVEEQGKVLAETRTIDELHTYKKLVKEFMDDAVKHGLSLEERRGFNRRGRTKIYKLVEEVDRKLIDLTNDVLDKQKSSLDILSKVGEIKGLLVNIYA
ncbi:YaaR family protein [Alkalihalobacillus sp. NPDC078783]